MLFYVLSVNNKLWFRSLLYGLAFISLTGCIFAPGMDMERSTWRLHGPDTIKVPSITSQDMIVEEYLDVIEINSSLIKELNSGKVEQTIPLLLLGSNTASDYKVGVNDVLSIIVWGQPELIATGGAGSNPLTQRQVRDDGTIFFPYAGVVHVEGKTRDEIRVDLTKELGTFFKDPQVDVSIEEYNSQKVILTGEFNLPTTLPINGTPLSLGEAIAIAKGVTDFADLTKLNITRDNNLYTLNYYELAQRGELGGLVLQAGDLIHMSFNQSNKAYVVGEVSKPSVINLMTGNVTLTDALGESEGIDQLFASGEKIYVLRNSDSSGKKIYRLDGSSPTAYLLSSDFKLQAQDVVFVGPSGLTKWNRVVSQLFPFFNAINIADEIQERN